VILTGLNNLICNSSIRNTVVDMVSYFEKNMLNEQLHNYQDKFIYLCYFSQVYIEKGEKP